MTSPETCKDCGKPIYQVRHLDLWYHWNTADMLTCPSVTIEPATESGLFDMLTFDELYELHFKLCRAHTAAHHQLMDYTNPRNPVPRISVFSDDWNLLHAHQTELWETIQAVSAEITSREQERTYA